MSALTDALNYSNRQIDSDSTAIEIAAHVAKSAYAD